MSQGELTDVKEELAQVVYENNQTMNRLKGDLKTCKQTSSLNINQLQECIGDKDDDLKKIRR